MEPELEAIFAREHLRLTAPRLAVFRALHLSNVPLTHASLAKRCPQADRTSIYRTIELFLRLGIVETVPLGWKQRYELTSPFKLHHHHLACTGCGKLVDIHSKKLELLAAHVAREHGFTAEDHDFEIRGLCAACQPQTRLLHPLA